MTRHILLADDHPVVLQGARMAITVANRDADLTLHEALSTDALVTHLQRHPCDLLLTDLSMPNGRFPDGITLIGYIRRHYPTLKVLVMTMLSSPALLRELLDQGVTGLFDKNQPLHELSNAVAQVGADRRYLSPSFALMLKMHGTSDLLDAPLSQRELEVLRLFGQSCNGRQIAERLNRSEKTISRQKRSAMEKLGLRHDSELVDYMRRAGLG
ncbi:response regulator [Pseudomonas asplenii]|uniref:response regulator n=1 Tax=Pseudomonas asplenii TaxID=53407 RepID=UPI0006B50AB2|nr:MULTISPECIES: response regulator [Pseudomonas]KPA97218.1 two component transcriptional regulator, LuxR family [Pseudomonas fuscovaginae]